MRNAAVLLMVGITVRVKPHHTIELQQMIPTVFLYTHNLRILMNIKIHKFISISYVIASEVGIVSCYMFIYYKKSV